MVYKFVSNVKSIRLYLWYVTQDSGVVDVYEVLDSDLYEDVREQAIKSKYALYHKLAEEADTWMSIPA